MNKLHDYILLLSTLAFISCNPECENIYNIRVDSLVKQQGQEMLIMSDNVSALEQSEIQFLSGGQVAIAKSKTTTDMGLIVEVPENIQGQNIQLAINDPDCGLSILGAGVTIGDAAFFANNPDFIPPAPFEFVIPAPPVAFPPLVQNAWISPQNTDYCIWFKFHPQTDNAGNIIMTEVNGQMVPAESVSLNNAQSFEFSVQELVCDGNGAGPNGICGAPVKTFYHCNPVEGIIDKENNFIHFWIDRTDINGQNFGIEEFVGEFINIKDAGYDQQAVPSCSSGIFDPDKAYLMLVTSQKTGRQLLLFQQGFL